MSFTIMDAVFFLDAILAGTTPPIVHQKTLCESTWSVYQQSISKIRRGVGCQQPWGNPCQNIMSKAIPTSL